jgi:hypothetical protein
LGGNADPRRCDIDDTAEIDAESVSASQALNPYDTRNRRHINARGDGFQFAFLCFIVFSSAPTVSHRNVVKI